MSDELFDYEADVLVVGSGAAGFSAAITAAQEGASVTMFECADEVGGTTALSGGSAWIPNNSGMRALGLVDDRDDALRYLARTAYPQYYVANHPTLGLAPEAYALLATLYDHGSATIDYLAEYGSLDVTPEVGVDSVKGFASPDYSAHLPENKVPEGRHVRPEWGQEGMIAQLHRGATRLGVDIRLGHRVAAALRNDEGAVFALEVHVGKRAVLARARKAVIFGSGGYAHNADYLRDFLPGRVYGTCASAGARGDFVRIGQELGTRFANMHNAWWKQVVLEPALRSPTPPSLFMPYGDAMLMVNKYGRRVVNEKAPYNERGQIHLQYDISGREYPNQVLFMIWDDTVADHRDQWLLRAPVPQPDEAVDYVMSADTLADLGREIDARLERIADDTGGTKLAPNFVATLQVTLERFNRYAEEGRDPEFHRGESPIEVDWSGPRRAQYPNLTMAPLRPIGPYHCTMLGAGTLDTNGGPAINERAQVLDAKGDPVPGLYGAGNCVASPAGQAYWGPGCTIGLALTFGHLAGRHAVAEPVKSTAIAGMS